MIISGHSKTLRFGFLEPFLSGGDRDRCFPGTTRFFFLHHLNPPVESVGFFDFFKHLNFWR